MLTIGPKQNTLLLFSMAPAEHVCAFALSTHSYENSLPSSTSFARHNRQISQRTVRGSVWKRRSITVCTAAQGKISEVVLSIDIGTSLAKSALVNFRTGELSSTVFSEGYDSYSEKPFHVTQKKKAWYASMIAVAANALRCRKRNEVLKAISVTGQMQDLLATGSHPPSLLEEDIILYSDARAGSHAERISTLVGQEIQPTSLLAKLALLPRPSSTSNIPRYRLMFGAADYAISRLADESLVFLTDPTTLSTTGLSEPSHRKYNTELLSKAGLQCFIPLFPRIQSSLKPCGKLSAQAALELGCPELAETPLVHAGGDAATATFGAGCLTSSDGEYLYVGTSGWIGRVARNDSLRNNNMSASGLFYLGHPDTKEDSLVLASLASAGSNFEYAASVLLGGIDLTEFNRLALSAPIGANGVLYVPYLSGRRCPSPSSRATGALCGLQPSTTTADIARAVVEGVAFAYKACYDELRFGHEKDDFMTGVLKVVGGGARSMALLNALSGAFSRPVAQGPTGDVGIQGAAFAALVALGEIEQRKFWTGGQVMTETSLTPGPERNEWSAAWAQWSSHVDALESTWR